MAVHTEQIGQELYIWMNGGLLMKRWIKDGRSVVFDVMPYDKNTVISITDKGTINRSKNSKS